MVMLGGGAGWLLVVHGGMAWCGCRVGCTAAPPLAFWYASWDQQDTHTACMTLGRPHPLCMHDPGAATHRPHTLHAWPWGSHTHSACMTLGQPHPLCMHDPGAATHRPHTLHAWPWGSRPATHLTQAAPLGSTPRVGSRIRIQKRLAQRASGLDPWGGGLARNPLADADAAPSR